MAESGKIVRIKKAEGIEERRRLIEAALRKRFDKAKEKKAKNLETLCGSTCIWIKDLTDTHVVFERGAQIHACPYRVSEAGKVTLGEPYPVGVEYVPLKK